MKIELHQYRPQVASILAGAFFAHGIDCKPINDSLVFRKERLVISINIYDMSNSSTAILQLDISIQIGLGKKIIDSCLGLGKNNDNAIEDGCNKFISNTLPVLLVAFFDKNCNEYDVSCIEWETDGQKLSMIMSPITTRGNSPEPLLLNWLDKFQKMLKQQDYAVGIHWSRLFYAQSERELMTYEILLDNKTWKEIDEIVHYSAYPKAVDFYSMRIFTIIKRGIDVSRVATTMAWMIDQSYEEIEKQLIEDGLSIQETEKAMVFIPLAFGRVFLKNQDDVQFSNEAMVTNSAEQQTIINLLDEPVYTNAYALAEQIMAHGYSNKNDFEAVLAQSSEFNAYNHALLDKVEQGDMNADNFGMPFLFLPHFNPPDVIKTPELILPKEKEEIGEEKKPFWQFWKK